MLIPFLVSKIENAHVTNIEPGNSNSIAIDNELINKSGLKEFQKVNIIDIQNGFRMESFVADLEESPGAVIIKGINANKFKVGDRITITAYALLDERELNSRSANILILDGDNKVEKVINGRL
jgi:aspartate 1-decarboxylase